jgi:hypothetical protein
MTLKMSAFRRPSVPRIGYSAKVLPSSLVHASAFRKRRTVRNFDESNGNTPASAASPSRSHGLRSPATKVAIFALLGSSWGPSRSRTHSRYLVTQCILGWSATDARTRSSSSPRREPLGTIRIPPLRVPEGSVWIIADRSGVGKPVEARSVLRLRNASRGSSSASRTKPRPRTCSKPGVFMTTDSFSDQAVFVPIEMSYKLWTPANCASTARTR